MLRTILSISLLLTTAATGCRSLEAPYWDPLVVEDMAGDGYRPPDLLPQLPKCAAAKGLVGDALVCVDFNQVSDLTNDPKVAKWNFAAIVAGNCPGWESNGGVLQVKNFGSFGGVGNNTCGFTLPQITQAQHGQYQRLTLSIQQRIDLFDTKQQAQIFLNPDTSATRLMWQGTGTKDVPAQQTTITMDSIQVPDTAGFSWLFKLSSQQALALKGWQFDSIAVIGQL